jgi:mono/diheme cytochrome c family protein
MDEPIDEAIVAHGLEIYKQQYCGICHQLDAAQTAGLFGPSHNGVGAHAAERIADPNYGGKATTPAKYLMESLVEPGIYYVPEYAQSRHPMPAYVHVPEADLDALVYMLLQQK